MGYGNFLTILAINISSAPSPKSFQADLHPSCRSLWGQMLSQLNEKKDAGTFIGDSSEQKSSD